MGYIFCTQNPTYIPEAVLSQLGLKIQHALRAFTAKDRKAIKKTVENYPTSDFYNTEELITSLGIGEALVTCLNEKGIPTPLAAILLRAPITRIDILEPKEIQELVYNSDLVRKYEKDIDRKSAHEILSKKIREAQQKEYQEEIKKQHSKGRKVVKQEDSFLEGLSKNIMVRKIRKNYCS